MVILTLTKKIIFIFLLLALGPFALASNPTSASSSLLNIETWTLSNGAKVYFVPSPILPIVDIEVVVDAGSSRDQAQFGIANLTNQLLGEGTTTLTTDQIAEQFEKVGAIFNNEVTRDSASLQLRSLTDPALLNPAITTFTDVVNHPNFPEKNFKRLQQQIRNALEQQQQSPATLAAKSFYAALYGNYPYGHSLLGNQDTLNNISVNDIKKFYQNFYVGKNALIVLVGNITKKQAESLAKQIVGQLPPGQKPAPLTSFAYQPSTYQHHINYPASQTNVLMGTLGIEKTDPKFFPLTVGDYILGGGLLTSRLFKEVRANKGYTYNINSYFVALKKPGPYFISFTSRNETAKDAIQLSKNLLNDFIQQGPTENELITAKKFLIGNFPLQIDNNQAITDTVANIGFYQLPLNYLDTYRQNINNVTHEQITSVFKTLINPEKLIVVTVGPQDAE